MAERQNFRRRLKAWIIGGLGGGLAAIAVFVMAVFDTQPKTVPDLDPQRPFETGQWYVMPLTAYAARQSVHGYPLKDRQAVVLEVQITNRTAETSIDYPSLFQPNLQLEASGRRPTVVLVRDFTGKTMPGLHPGMDERVAFLWLLPQAGAIPSDLQLIVNTKHYKAQDNLKGLPGWFNQEPLGRLTMAVAPDDGRATP